MNQKEYELVAETLADYMPMNTLDPEYSIYLANWCDIVNNFTVNLEKNYANFDRAKFLKACGVDT